jgi:pyrroloquinoline quinone biosynthesis protein D
MLSEDTVPKLAVGVKFRFDQVRDAWVLLAPERLFQPDAIAAEILKLIDGHRNLSAITDALALQYQAPRAVIAADVVELLQHLSDRGALKL